MKFNRQQRFTIAIISTCLLGMEAIQLFGLGKYIQSVFPCTTHPYDSAYCYAAYDGLAFAVLGIIAVGGTIGLAIDIIRHKKPL